MEIFHEYQKEIFSVASAALTGIIRYFGKPRARLIWAVPATFSHQVQPPVQQDNAVQTLPPLLVHTRAVILRNDGKEPLTNVQVLFNGIPGNINLWPPRLFQKTVHDQDQRCTLTFDTLAPGESVDIQLLAVDNVALPLNAGGIPAVLSVKAKEVLAVLVDIRPSIAQPKWVLRIKTVLMLTGIAGIIFVGLSVLKWLVS